MRVRVEAVESADEEALGRVGGEALALIWWGSDCDRCGNATPDSTVCDECGLGDRTRSLWVERSR